MSYYTSKKWLRSQYEFEFDGFLFPNKAVIQENMKPNYIFRSKYTDRQKGASKCIAIEKVENIVNGSNKPRMPRVVQTTLFGILNRNFATLLNLDRSRRVNF